MYNQIINCCLRPSFETDVDVAGGDITSLYVSMYKRDYYMHHKDQLPITDLARSHLKANGGEENKNSEVSRGSAMEHGVALSPQDPWPCLK